MNPALSLSKSKCAFNPMPPKNFGPKIEKNALKRDSENQKTFCKDLSMSMFEMLVTKLNRALNRIENLESMLIKKILVK